MRVLLDTNIFISYLLTPQGRSVTNRVVEAAFSGVYTLLIPPELTAELTHKAATKAYLAKRINQDELAILVLTLLEIGEVIPDIAEEIPAVSRDRKDDYLLAYAVVGQADYLVTGDEDLLILNEIEGVTILRPAAFAEILDQ